jgi:hypothetical protein
VALLATALAICEFFGAPPPFAYLVGDVGTGEGSRELYAHLEADLSSRHFDSLTFHYIQPDVDWHNRVFFAVDILTGLVAALTGLGHDVPAACRLAAKIGRLAGKLADPDPDPGTQVSEIIVLIAKSAARVFESALILKKANHHWGMALITKREGEKNVIEEDVDGSGRFAVTFACPGRGGLQKRRCFVGRGFLGPGLVSVRQRLRSRRRRPMGRRCP